MTAESVYILGLIWADGNLSKTGNAVTVTCVSEDLCSLNEVFLKTAPWKIYIRKAKGIRKEQQTFYLCDKQLHSFLSNCDYIAKSWKSAGKILSCIPEHLKHYWWRGFSDGDGCFYTKKHFCFFFTSGINQDWHFVNELGFKLGFEWKTIEKVTKNGSYSRRLANSKTKLQKFGEYIYQGYDKDLIGFPRKYKKFRESYLNRRIFKGFRGKGVWFSAHENKWKARIAFKKINYHLGTFLTELEALNAVKNKREELLSTIKLLGIN